MESEYIMEYNDLMKEKQELKSSDELFKQKNQEGMNPSTSFISPVEQESSEYKDEADLFFDEIEEEAEEFSSLSENATITQNEEENNTEKEAMKLNNAFIASPKFKDRKKKLAKGQGFTDEKISEKLKETKDKKQKEISKKQQEMINREEYLKRSEEIAKSPELEKSIREKTSYIHRGGEEQGKLKGIKKAILKSGIDQSILDSYNKALEFKKDGGESKLHHSKGSRLLNEGHNVLEFNLAGTGFYGGFRRESQGVKGRADKNIFGGKRDDATVEKIYERVYGKEQRFKSAIRKIKNLDETDLLLDEEGNLTEEISESNFDDCTESEYLHKDIKGIRCKERANEAKGCIKRRYTIPGIDGAFNSGDFAIDKVRVYIKDLGAQFLTGIFDEWKERNIPMDEIKDVHINLQGHSRGAVGATLGAMTLRGWIAENYPQFLSKVKFDLIAHEPVPGMDADSLYRKEVDVKRRLGGDTTDEVIALQKSGNKMLPLGDSANTTVFYSLSSKEGLLKQQFFDPMMLKGANRIILTSTGHHSTLKNVDTSQYKDKKGQVVDSEEKAHNMALTDAATKEVYRGSGVGDLPGGVYFMDEGGTLLKINTKEDYEKIMAKVGVKMGERERNKRINAVVNDFYDEQEWNKNKIPSVYNFNGAISDLYDKSTKDKKKKSTSYMLMENALKAIITKKEDDISSTYSSKLTNALIATRNYIATHSRFHITKSGDERLAFAKSVEAALLKEYDANTAKGRIGIINEVESLQPDKNISKGSIKSLKRTLMYNSTRTNSENLDALRMFEIDRHYEQNKIARTDALLDGKFSLPKQVGAIHYDGKNRILDYILSDQAEDSLASIIKNIEKKVDVKNLYQRSGWVKGYQLCIEMQKKGELSNAQIERLESLKKSMTLLKDLIDSYKKDIGYVAGMHIRGTESQDQ